ncbi:hypothetical protein [Melittangium boletus]|uniref:Uncharacterized protein n=1 Tax=Melittangium boletus DSM 14713 TaxID=1294270 RepID=A0A250IHT6_9BACT|nr:hypothetical protein [Melittangium boletus]ATB30732.1 hypothetical protein MEBOL_004193 [Melittangium boletus DSM 14713]
MQPGRHGKLWFAFAAAGAVSLALGLAVVSSTSVEKSTVKPGPVTQAQSDPNQGLLSAPYPVFPRGNSLMQSLTDESPEVKRFVDFYNGVSKVTIPPLDRDSLVALPNRYLDIAHNGLNVSSGDFNTSLVCQSCHDSDWKASGKDIGDMTFWSQRSVTEKYTEQSKSLAANWSLFGDWSASIKALAGRDPVFLAQVENTRSLSPHQPEQVDNLCLRCHSPMGQRQAEKNNLRFSHYMLYSTPPDSGYTHPFSSSGDPDSKYADPKYAVYGALGRDGVSCSACHSISPNGGLPWNGTDYSIFYGSDTQSIYGSGLSNRLKDLGDADMQPPPFPFTSSMNTRPGTVVAPDSDLNIAPMAAAGLSLETATTNDPNHNYLEDSTVCGSCHVVVLPKVPDQYSGSLTIQQAMSRGGYTRPASCPTTQTNFTGDFLTDPCVALAYEQTTYFEWLNSGFAPTTTCMTCHMPLQRLPSSGGGSDVAQVNEDVTKFYGNNTGLAPREYNRHTLLGINLFVHEMFQQFPDVLGIEYYLKTDSLIPPYLQDDSIRNQTGNLVSNPGAENGNAKGWVAKNSQIQAVKSAEVVKGTVIKPNHGQYFFAVGDGQSGGSVSLTFDVSQYGYGIDKGAGSVKATWGAASYCPTRDSCQALILSQDVGGGAQLVNNTPGQWTALAGDLALSPKTRSLTVTLQNGSWVDDLFLALRLPDGSVRVLQDAQRQYTVAKNLLNAEQSILDLAVNTSRGVFNPDTPAAQVRVSPPAVSGSDLKVDVTVTTNVGHKFPSGAGFRRAFLQLEVLDGVGNVLWASGQPNAWGAICDGVCKSDGSNYLSSEFTSDYTQLQPHHQVITKQSQAQIYELRVTDDYNKLTSTELQQFNPVKDNRILPYNWTAPSAQKGGQLLGLDLKQLALLTQPMSIVQGSNDTSLTSDPDYNADYAPGYDQLTYQIPLSEVVGWKSVRARVNYQTIPPFYLSARFKEALPVVNGKPATPGPAMSRLIYMTSRLNTQTGLRYTNSQNKQVDFVSNWTMVLSEWTQPAH